MKPIQLSFVVPVYNTRPYLAECLDSLRAQRNVLEIICVNDGSTDDSGEFLDAYAKQDKRISVIHQENKGLSEARNRGMKEVHGTHVAFIDSDDWLTDRYSSILEDAIGKFSPDILIVNGRVEDQAANTTYPFYDNHIFASITAVNSHVLLDGTLHKNYFLLEPNTSKRVFSKKFIDRINLQYPAGLLYEDVPVHFEIGLMTRNIVVTSQIGFVYRVTSSESLTRENGARRLHSVDVHRLALESLKAHNAQGYVYEAFIHALVRFEKWCYSQATDVKIKEKIRAGTSEIFHSIPDSHMRVFWENKSISEDTKKKVFAFWHNAPFGVVRACSLPFLHSVMAKPFFFFVRKF